MPTEPHASIRDADKIQKTHEIPQGTIKRIHVNQHIIRRNAKQGTQEPPISVKVSGGSLRCSSAEILGPSRVVYSASKPLACGARVWVETTSAVRLDLV